LALAKEDGDLELKKSIVKKDQSTVLKKQKKYIGYQNTIDTTGVTQISTSDPDSRQIMTQTTSLKWLYTVQTTVDALHNIPIDFKVTNENDSKAMGGMLRQNHLGTQQFYSIYDKGYTPPVASLIMPTGLNIDVLVAIPAVSAHAPDTAFDVEHFKYHKETDTYTCPPIKP
jgi:hypothetical protein